MQFSIILLLPSLVLANRRIPWRNLDPSQRQGPNVCAVEVDDTAGYVYHTERKYWNPRNICGKQTMIKYECCTGFYKVRGITGCVGVKPMLDIVGTVHKAGATKFAKLLEVSGFATNLMHDSIAVTVFAPTDQSFDDYLARKGIRMEWMFAPQNYINLVANHVVNRRLPSDRWEADSLIPTKLQGHLLRINKYSNNIETVNCRHIIRKDQLATNGMVHVIDGVLDSPLYENSDIVDLAGRDGRFTVFRRMLEASGLARRIKWHCSPHTIFAPTDEAFRKVPQETLSAILGDPKAADALLARHIVPQPVCASSIISAYEINALQHEKLQLECAFRTPTVENVKISKSTLHAKNGLLYAMNEVLIPDRAKNVLELVREEGLLMFLQVIRTAMLEETLLELRDYTMFAPVDTAMQAIPYGQQVELRRNQDSAKRFVFNHIAAGRYVTRDIINNQVIASFDQRKPLRLQVYRGTFGIENALIRKADKEGRNGVLHVVGHVLNPTEQSLSEILREDGNFSIFLQAMDILKDNEWPSYEQFTCANSSCTYFVPTDEAFGKLGNTELYNLMENHDYLTMTLKNHMTDNMMISDSIKSDLQYAIKTKQNIVNVLRKDDEILVNDAIATKCDMLNKNGVAHEISTVLLPNQCPRNFRSGNNFGIANSVCQEETVMY